MTTNLESCDSLALSRLTLGNAQRETFVVSFILVALLAPCTRSAETANSTQTNEQFTKAYMYEPLRERVRTEPRKDLSYSWFDVLITVRRIGGCLWAAAPLSDPADPRTLEKNFDGWNLTARVSLLLAYAEFVTEADKSCDYSGLPEQQMRALRSHAAVDRARIAQLAQAGGYARSWQPFIVAYRKWIKSADAILPHGDTAGDAREQQETLARRARELGMFQLVRELPIDPGDVASEMLRLVDNWRSSQGSPGEATDHGPNLLYVCDSGDTTVRVHPWHSLAPAFFRAWDAVDKKRSDPQAQLIMAMFDGITKDIKKWTLAHRDADWGTRDRALNDMAKTRGLYSLLEK
jgi:hypothetical protein